MASSIPIQTPSLTVRPLRFGDTDSMLQMSQEPCARQWLPSQVYTDETQAAAGIKLLIEQFDLRASPLTNAFVFGVEQKATGRLIGHVGLSPLFGSVEVGFGIAASEQRKGFATDAVAAVCGWAFERFSLDAILGVTDADNLPSQRVLTRSGFFPKEKRSMRFQGVDRPVILFAIRKHLPGPTPDPTTP